mgnify:FL=1
MRTGHGYINLIVGYFYVGSIRENWKVSRALYNYGRYVPGSGAPHGTLATTSLLYDTGPRRVVPVFHLDVTWRNIASDVYQNNGRAYSVWIATAVVWDIPYNASVSFAVAFDDNLDGLVYNNETTPLTTRTQDLKAAERLILDRIRGEVDRKIRL